MVEPGAPRDHARVSLVGQELGGRYRVIKQIGKGGMATVFHVEDTELSEEVALKLFNAGDDDPAALARFRQELKLSRQLVHPNIVRLYDIGVDQGRRYLTMELLSGRDLHAFMGRPMAFGRGLNYLMQACAGLFAAHQQGVVHRDIKPENLFITDKGVLKVMDFGIAKGQVKSGMTMEGVTAGTPKYMSPEQINSFGQVTAATDLYAMGIVAYEMFTGRCPFDGDQLMHILMAQMSQPPPPPRQFNAAIPEALERIILKCLEKDPTQRFATARDLAMALDPLRRHFEGQRAPETWPRGGLVRRDSELAHHANRDAGEPAVAAAAPEFLQGERVGPSAVSQLSQ